MGGRHADVSVIDKGVIEGRCGLALDRDGEIEISLFYSNQLFLIEVVSSMVKLRLSTFSGKVKKWSVFDDLDEKRYVCIITYSENKIIFGHFYCFLLGRNLNNLILSPSLRRELEKIKILSHYRLLSSSKISQKENKICDDNKFFSFQIQDFIAYKSTQLFAPERSSCCKLKFSNLCYHFLLC